MLRPQFQTFLRTMGCFSLSWGDPHDPSFAVLDSPLATIHDQSRLDEIR
jgi:hypothetical protein